MFLGKCISLKLWNQSLADKLWTYCSVPLFCEHLWRTLYALVFLPFEESQTFSFAHAWIKDFICCKIYKEEKWTIQIATTRSDLHWGKINVIFFLSCLLTYLFILTWPHMPWCTYEGWRTACRSVFFFQYEEIGDWTQVVRNGSRHLFPLRHLTSSFFIFFVVNQEYI